MAKGKTTVYTMGQGSGEALGAALSKRLDDEHCRSCRHWRAIDERKGECLRYAPSPATMGEMEMSTRSDACDARWPVTFALACCGEWEVTR